MSLPARTSPVRLLAAAGAALVAAVVAGCAPADSSSSASGAGTSGSAAASGSASAAACSKDQLATKTKGKLTIATDKPVYEPWFKDDKPENGQGFEGAVAYAVAQKLGYAQGDVTWTRASFDSVTQPGPKNFDFDINEVSITDKRKQAVDFSSGYYDVTQAIITVKGSKIANAKSIADLKDAKIGAQVGTTSLDTIKNTIKPVDGPGRVQHERRRRQGPRERPDRRPRHRPADGVLHHGLRPGEGQHDRRPVREHRRQPRAVRARPRQGQRR